MHWCIFLDCTVTVIVPELWLIVLVINLCALGYQDFFFFMEIHYFGWEDSLLKYIHTSLSQKLLRALGLFAGSIVLMRNYGDLMAIWGILMAVFSWLVKMECSCLSYGLSWKFHFKTGFSVLFSILVKKDDHCVPEAFHYALSWCFYKWMRGFWF